MFPSAIMFGMSSKEFWEEDPQLYWAYQTFYLKQQEMKFDRDNQYMWLQGMYIYEGVSVALHNAFQKTHRSYTEKPYDLKSKANEKEMTKEEINDIVLQKNNSWSRIL